jgi:hypothetical protein
MKKQNQNIVKNKKIAILLCGHIRNAKIIDFLNTTKEDIDVFVFTWDDIGHRGTIGYTPNQEIDNYYKDQIENFIQKIPQIKKYKIENLQENLKSLKKDFEYGNYFCYKTQPIFIKSQLYTIQSCYRLMKNYCYNNLINYDLVIKFRFDCEVEKFIITKKLEKYTSNSNVLFVSNNTCHSHPYFPNGCMICNKLYKEEISTIHLEEHSNIICDFFVYGNTKAMENYCNLFDKFDEINKSFENYNFEKIQKNNINYTQIENNYYVSHLDSILKIKCCYPERLMQQHLKNMMLISSEDITCSWILKRDNPLKIFYKTL